MANFFGAVNRFISRLDSDPNTVAQSGGNKAQSQNHYGFQVVRNTNASVAIEPWFDFIIGINGHNIDDPDPNLFIQEVKNCAGNNVSLGVYGAKGSTIREVYVSIPPHGEGLGLALQWSPLSAVDDVWHILDVMPNSPADVAGLLPFSDYVIGSPEGSLHGDAGLGQLVEAFLNRPLRLFVYNQEYDVTRMVTITPAKNWGGDGALGCILGYGALHRIPAPLGEPSTGPGETLFDGQADVNGAGYQPPIGGDTYRAPVANADFLVPANMDFAGQGTSPPPSGGPPSGAPPKFGKSKKPRAYHAGKVELDDYFAEGEQKSRELEGTSTPKPRDGLPPPPPKAGEGPPKATSPVPPADDDKTETASQEA